MEPRSIAGAALLSRRLVAGLVTLQLFAWPCHPPAWGKDARQPAADSAASQLRAPSAPSLEKLLEEAGVSPSRVAPQFGRDVAAAQASRKPSSLPVSLQEAFKLIQVGCDSRFLSAVKRSGRFLYRGEMAKQPALLAPEPDLLQLDTYGSEEALRYFASLERLLAASGAMARPSSGHIGVARLEAAAQWGDAVSIWPLGKPLAFVWPRARSDFWPDDAVSSRSTSTSHDYVVDEDLSRALSLGREVLFATDTGAFIAVPASWDLELWRHLQSS